MDSGELDFYQHDKVCSNTCRSTKIDLSGARVSLSSPTAAEYLPLTPATADGMCHASPGDPPTVRLAAEGTGGGRAPRLGPAAAPFHSGEVGLNCCFQRQGRVTRFVLKPLLL